MTHAHNVLLFSKMHQLVFVSMTRISCGTYRLNITDKYNTYVENLSPIQQGNNFVPISDLVRLVKMSKF